ncbi:SMP-30/Gluconolaconase/LRE-like region-containing protein [Caldithrix abyssi DSM 13497]|uniref:Gluconolactonase n=1 Tax=Caldithrix abyssi DSM 13497 TaxID=880073 RepID=H1XVB8_CALAY|nr:SMP-30/gluconolactonase/LRE family protein [Caldithrix abyssi]APF20921.1 gluconolactonase [Caldithrix abyssi DSM 13497]EHO40624.1 SMP-30/Gluconolaconase/LRE-like region-containing protein [Caldithrix abyssi DSM 13497]
MKYFVFALAAILLSCQNQPAFNLQFEKVAQNLQFPEGPAWDGQNTLYFSNCYGNWLGMVQNDEVDTLLTVDSTQNCFRQTNGLTFHSDGYLYACDFGLGAIERFDRNGSCQIIEAGFNRPNDLAFGPEGHLYITDPKSYDKDTPDGCVYRYNFTIGKIELVADSLCFPNGIAFTADGKSVFVAESAQNRVLKFTVESDGKLTHRRIFAEMPGGDPDGIALDVRGNVYVAHFGAGRIAVFDPRGQLIASIPTPGKKPSNLEFADPDLKTLYVTEDETNALYRARVPIAGLALSYQQREGHESD